MFRKSRLFWTLGLIFIAAMEVPPLSFGQDYPTKTIELIAPFPPGGLGPLIASLVAEEAKKYLPKPMVVVHKPGAAGTIGAYYVAKAPADGYTLMLTAPASITSSHLIQNFEFSPLDFDYISGAASAPITLAVRTDAPWKNLKELVAYAKQNPGIVTCGNPGANSSTHLYALLFEKMTGIKLTHVPFKGSADAVTAVAGGHTMMAVRYPSEGEPLVDAGKVRILSVLDTKRCKFYPNVPTSTEEGFSTAVLKSWRAVMAPRGIPKPILGFHETLMKKIASDQAFVEKAEKLKIGIEFRSGEDMRRDQQKDLKNFSELVKELKLKAN